ncbi:DEAD/DEAH box helicase [Sphingobacterium spiritivorum]|uniref:DEAD/DEAH box helicase n=1 Tax=Sphingobacterium spiritivorum TaxID=258 RepID=UPI0019183DE1|nr:DEAD/DEAH box helicase family protein [Sphingobacterium spiritivorum]QQT26846.1 DEAD/DEAH box helicase family protein [Sphingobacterium spiritivorum]
MKVMLPTLRPYQAEFVKNLAVALRDHRRVIACAPTGSGKTKMFIDVAYKSISNGRAVVIISETTKIFDQIIGEAGGIEIANGKKHVHIKAGQLYIAMAQTLTRRPLILEQLAQLEFPPLIIVDEAHIGTPSNIIRRLIEVSNPYILGFTATPDGRVAKHLAELYNTCVICCQVDELIQQGFLCSYQHLARTKADTDILEMRNGEYTEQSQTAAFSTSAVYDGIFEDLRSATFKKCMIFVSSIKHAREMNQRLQDEGFASVEYHSQLENSSYELAKFTGLGLANICVSVASLTKGFDAPAVDLVILNRATTSLPLYLQMIGRGSRPVWSADGTPLKTHFRVLDYGGNWERHGLYFEDRDWENMWEVTKRSKKGQGVAPVALCSECESIIPSSVRICQYCGHERPLTEKELEQGELVEVTSHYTSLVGRKISELTPNELAIYAKMKKKQVFATRVAKAKEQMHKGFLSAFGAAMGYKSNWVDIQSRMIGSMPIEFTDIQLR